MAQLAKCSLPIHQDYSSNPVMVNFLCYEKGEIHCKENENDK